MAPRTKTLMKTGYLGETDRRRLRNRIRRIQGQLDGVRRMIDEEACVDEILTQVAAARGAVQQVAIVLVQEHLTHCAENCMPGSQADIIRRVTAALTAVLKGTP